MDSQGASKLAHTPVQDQKRGPDDRRLIPLAVPQDSRAVSGAVAVPPMDAPRKDSKWLERSFFERDFLECARALVGCELVWGQCAGRIVETEAYAAVGDEACHTFRRKAARDFVERNPAGTAYVYLNYGMHWLINVLVKGGGEQDGIVLLRALAPTAGLEQMQLRRGRTELRDLCSGPGRLSQALGITGHDHQRDLCGGGAVGIRKLAAAEVVADVRIGISRAVEFPWRFLEAESLWVSVQATGRGGKRQRPGR
jgi:DNA-3-methyladenine glycosylase